VCLELRVKLIGDEILHTLNSMEAGGKGGSTFFELFNTVSHYSACAMLLIVRASTCEFISLENN